MLFGKQEPKPQEHELSKPEVQQPAIVQQPTVHQQKVYTKQQFKSAEEIPKELIKSHTLLKGTATYIMDGDTFKFYHITRNEQPPSSIHQLKQETITIRLAGIDTPETPKQGKQGQPFGKEAKDFLANLIHQKQVIIELLSKDQYGRLIAAVSVNGVDVSIELFKHGLAHVYEGKGASYGSKEMEMRQCCKEAKQRKKGLWSQSNVQTPAEYKQSHK